MSRHFRYGYDRCKANAASRGIFFGLTFEEYKELTSTNQCFYDPSHPLPRGGGLDRKDSWAGYTKNNVVPCCERCNNEKGVLPFDEWMPIVEARLKNKSPAIFERLSPFLPIFDEMAPHIDTQNQCIVASGIRVFIPDLQQRNLVIRPADGASLTFFSSELISKPEIIRSIVATSAGSFCTKLQARKLELKAVSTEESKLFQNVNHFKGYSAAPAMGLYRDDELVSLLSYKQQADGILEINRFCNKLHTIVNGGFSRLLAAVINEKAPKLVSSFCDRRSFTGHSYRTCGFVSAGVTKSWFWTDGVSVFNRLRCRANMDDRRLSQQQHAEELGWWQVYDAGQEKFFYTVDSTKHKFAGKGTESWEDLTARLDTHGLTVLTQWDEYNALLRHKPLLLQCKEAGHVFQRPRHRLLKILRCPECDGRSSFLTFQEKIEQKGWRYIAGVYNSKVSVLTAVCTKGHQISRPFRWLRDNVCPFCQYDDGLRKSAVSEALSGNSYARRKAVYNQIVSHCEDSGQTLLTDWVSFEASPFPSRRVPVTIRCSNGHERTTFWQVASQHGCGECNKKKQKTAIKKDTPKTEFSSSALPINIGDKFNALTILAIETSKMIVCRCDCGQQIIIDKYKLIHGATKSCGCLQYSKDNYREVEQGDDIIPAEAIESRLRKCGYVRLSGAVRNDYSRINVRCLACQSERVLAWHSLAGNCQECYKKDEARRAFVATRAYVEANQVFLFVDDFEAYYTKCQMENKRNSLVKIAIQCSHGHQQQVAQGKLKTKTRWVCPACILALTK